MAGMATRQAEVGYFVMHISGLGQGVRQAMVEADAGILVHLADAMLQEVTVERRLFFIHQVIGRHMLRTEADSLLQIRLPTCIRLAGQAVDKVDAQVVKPRLPAPQESVHGLPGSVPPAQ